MSDVGKVDYSNYLVIDDSNYVDHIGPVEVVDGVERAKGLIPRDYIARPQGYYKSAPPFDPKELPIIPRENWSELIKEKVAKKTRLSDLRNVSGPNGNRIPALDQNGQGYCWFYSGTMCVMMLRMVANMPYVRLSAHSGAWVIKKGKDQGGWGCQGLDYIQDKGICTVDDWPEKSMDGRQYNTAENWEKAKQYRVTESWMDLEPRQYDRDMTFDQVMTCLLSNIPVIGDFNWWGHSVCLVDAHELDSSKSLSDPNRWGTATINSWSDNWGTNGYGILKGRKGIPDGGAAPRVPTGG